jgi:small subunit ribosomal protein S21
VPKVTVKDNEPIEIALRRFKKLVSNAKIVATYRMHKEFMNPREKRKFKQAKSGKGRSR